MTSGLIQTITFVLFFSLSISCTGGSSSSSHNKTNDNYMYVDGDYYAEVKYYNPKTGKRSTYTLKVEVKNDKLVKIYWSNGGWLDDSHFTPPDISSGIAFFTSDRDYRYVVTILEDVEVEEDDDRICSLCGSRKYSIDDYCDDCQEEEDNIYDYLNDDDN